MYSSTDSQQFSGTAYRTPSQSFINFSGDTQVDLSLFFLLSDKTDNPLRTEHFF